MRRRSGVAVKQSNWGAKRSWPVIPPRYRPTIDRVVDRRRCLSTLRRTGWDDVETAPGDPRRMLTTKVQRLARAQTSSPPNSLAPSKVEVPPTLLLVDEIDSAGPDPTESKSLHHLAESLNEKVDRSSGKVALEEILGLMSVAVVAAVPPAPPLKPVATEEETFRAFS